MMHFEKQPPQPLDAMNQKILSQTPLHYACYRGDVDMVELLLGRTLSYNTDEAAARSCISAMIEEEDTINGWTPAHWASCYGQLTCLMKLHVRPNVGFDKSSERSNTSPLHLAAQTGAILCLKWLLQCGATINRQDFMGETALHKAAKAGNTDSAAMLVSHGSVLEVKNHRGSTAAHLAELANHLILAQYLRRCNQGPLRPNNDKSQTPAISQPFTLPISDLNTTATSLPHPPHAATVSLNSPFIIQPSSFIAHQFDGDHAKSAAQGESNNNNNNGHNTNNCMAGVEGDELHQSMSYGGMHRCDVEFMSSESLSSASGGSQTYSDGFEGSAALSSFAGLKRSLDDEDDDDEDTMEDDDEVVLPTSKRRCFVSNQQNVTDADRYGSAYNNNVISSYNAVLAMGVEPMHHGGKDPPVAQSSSVQEHAASLIAEQGYDSSLMNSFKNVFM